MRRQRACELSIRIFQISDTDTLILSEAKNTLKMKGRGRACEATHVFSTQRKLRHEVFLFDTNIFHPEVDNIRGTENEPRAQMFWKEERSLSIRRMRMRCELFLKNICARHSHSTTSLLGNWRHLKQPRATNKLKLKLGRRMSPKLVSIYEVRRTTF